MCVALVLFASAPPLHGQQAYILTVGFDDGGERDQYAHDARDMQATLEKLSAYPVSLSYCLAGKQAQLTSFMDKLNTFKQRATTKDIVMLFFSVHSGTDNGHFSITMTDADLSGAALAKAFNEIQANVVLFIDGCGAGGMLNHSSTNKNVAVMLGCKADEETFGAERSPLHGYYANAIYAALAGAADRDRNGVVSLRELDRYLLDPKHVVYSHHQHAVSAVPKHMAGLRMTKKGGSASPRKSRTGD